MRMISILIVDDEPVICESIAFKINQLEHSAKYVTECCNSVKTALIKIQENHYDLIITDIKMPFITGLQLIKQLRENGSDVLIFVLSGFDNFDYVREAFLNGANDYLLKPIAVSDLDIKFKEYMIDKGKNHCAAENPFPDQEAESGKNVIDYAKEYIEAHFSDTHLSMEDVAAHISVSYSYFSALFRKNTGSTFPAYLRNLRIEKAIELLKDPSMKINEVCYRVGFKYPQQFSSQFKKATGMYPTDYVAKNYDKNRLHM